MDNPTPVGDPTVLYSGKLIQLLAQEVRIGSSTRFFEFARRAPGTRIIATSVGSILAIEEYRFELGRVDLRIPGGKVFDSLDDYQLALASDPDMTRSARAAAQRELLEETGYEAGDLRPLAISRSGATIDWDLHYFHADIDLHQGGQQRLELGENIRIRWMQIPAFIEACLDGRVDEDRSVAQIMRFFRDRFRVYG